MIALIAAILFNTGKWIELSNLSIKDINFILWVLRIALVMTLFLFWMFIYWALVAYWVL